MVSLFTVAAALLLGATLLAAWRRRNAVPYDDPLMTVEALRDRQRFLYEFGMAVGPPPGRAERKEPHRR